MRKFYLIMTLLLLTMAGWSQTRKTWSGGNGSWNTGGNWSPTGVPGTGDTVVFNGNTAIVTNVAFSANINLGKLIVTGNSAVTLQAANTRTLTINNGTGVTDLVVDNGSSLTIGTNVNITLNTNSTAAVDGTLVVNSGRTYTTSNGGNSTVVNGTLQNNGGTINSTTARLSFGNGGTYIHAVNGGTVPDAGWNANSNCNITGMNDNYPGGMDQPFGNVTFASNLTDDVEIGGNLDCAGNLTLSNTGAAGNDLRLTNSNTSRTVTVDKNFKMTSGSFSIDHDNGGSELNVAGDFEITGGTLKEDGDVGATVTVNFDGNTQQLFTKSGGTISGSVNFVVNGGAIVNFGTSVLNGSAGSFTLASTGKVITANAGGLPATIQVSGTKTYSSGADYEFGGAITGVFTTSPTASTARNIIINNTGGNVTLSQPMAVTGSLSLQHGELRTTATNLITVNDNATANATTSSFVVGPITKKGNDNFVFPTGRAGAGLIPIAISGLTSNSDFQAEHKANPASTAGATITANGLDHVSYCEYWMLTRATGSATANVTLYWNSFSNCNSAAYVTDLASIVVAHSNGTSWNSFKRDGGTSGNAISGTVTWNAVSTFSPFALGSTAAAANPLPVLFDNVRAYEKNNGVQIEWSNLTERDLVDYTIEHSVNGRDFTTLSKQLPKSNQNDKADYTAFDAAPAAGSNFYRIKVQEIAGKVIMSKILRVEIGNVKQSFTLYPNPVSGSQLTLSLTGIRSGQYNVKVINTTGQQVYQKLVLSQGGSISETLTLPAVKAGMYTMLVSGDGYQQSRNFIVQ